MTARSDAKKIKLKTLANHGPGLLFALGVFILLAGVFLSLRQQHQNTVTTKQVQSSPAAPSIVKPTPSDFDTYTAPSDLPRYLFISKINVKAIVRSLGLTKANQIQSPANVYDTGWYNESSKPGLPGAALIDGHLSSWNANGVFYNLKSLKPGDTIQIQRGDGVKITYSVVRSQTYDADKVDTVAMLQPVTPGEPGLNLITCAGDVIKGTNDFSKRIVVFAEQI